MVFYVFSRRGWKRRLAFVALGFVCASVLFGMAFDIRLVSSVSMAPTLHGGGDRGVSPERVLISRWAFAFGRPMRFDVVVAAIYDRLIVKRITGLPGESLEIVDGDLYIDGELCRKTDAEWHKVRVLLHDIDRWDLVGEKGFWKVAGAGFAGQRGTVRIGTAGERGNLTLSTEERVRSEFRRPDGSVQSGFERVRDVGMEVDLDRGEGRAKLEVRFDRVLGHSTRLFLEWQGGILTGQVELQDGRVEVGCTTFRAKGVGRRCQLAFRDVDRRLRLEIRDGDRILVNWVQDLEEDAARSRVLPAGAVGDAGVGIRLEASGFAMQIENLRVFRDLHYAGHQGLHGVSAVHTIGPDHYFLLGDNSIDSLDSRSWGDVACADLRGKVLAVVTPLDRWRWLP